MQPSDLEPFGVGFPQLFTTSPTSRVSEWIDLCFFCTSPNSGVDRFVFFQRSYPKVFQTTKKHWKKKKGVQNFGKWSHARFFWDSQKLIFLPSLRLTVRENTWKDAFWPKRERTHLPTMDFQVKTLIFGKGNSTKEAHVSTKRVWFVFFGRWPNKGPPVPYSHDIRYHSGMCTRVKGETW